jgi:hypothetical protein
MPARIYFTIIVVALVGALLSFPSAGATSVPCENGCFKELTAKTRAKRWVTPQRFRDAIVTVSVVTDEGTVLPSVRKANGCKAIYHGHKLRVVVRACGPEPTALRVIYRSEAGRESFTVTYEAGPAVE